MKLLLVSLALLLVAPMGLAASVNLNSVLGQCKQLSGKSVNQLQQRATVLTFGASWCPFCKELLPKNQALAGQYAGVVNFVEIETGASVLADSQKEAQSYSNISFYFNDPDTLTNTLGITGYPTSVILDKYGSQVFKGFAEDDFNAYQAAIESVAN